MPRIRKQHKDGFTTIGNELIQNPALSWKARGIIIYLLSMPEDWLFNLEDLSNRAPEGRSALRSGIKELEDLGYVHIVRERQDNGQWDGWIWYVYEEPQPRCENRTSVNSTSEKKTLQRKQSTKKTETKEDRRDAPTPDGVFEYEMLDEYDSEFDCQCGEHIIIADLPNTRATCPGCGIGLRIKGFRSVKPKLKPLTIKDLIPDCPDRFANWRVKRTQRTRLLDAHALHDDMLWDCLNWARSKVAKGDFGQDQAIGAGLGWFDKRAVAMVDEPEPEPDHHLSAADITLLTRLSAQGAL